MSSAKITPALYNAFMGGRGEPIDSPRGSAAVQAFKAIRKTLAAQGVTVDDDMSGWVEVHQMIVTHAITTLPGSKNYTETPPMGVRT